MTDYASMNLAELQRRYVADSTDAMPMAGAICWAALAVTAYLLGDALPYWAILVAPAAPLPLAALIDKVRGRPTAFDGDTKHPMQALFMTFISVIGVMIFFVIVAARAAESLAILAFGVGLLSGLIWVPYGWSAGDRVGIVQFFLRAGLCFAAYFFAPEPLKVAAIAAAVAVSYLHVLFFMKKPERAS